MTDINLNRELFIGLDLGGTAIKAGIVRADGTVVAKTAVATGTGPDEVIANLGRAAEMAAQQAGISVQQATAIGVTSPGALAISRGVVLRAGNLPGFSDVPLRAKVSALLQRPAILENDANAAAFGESWVGAARHGAMHNVVLFTFGTGIGGGIVQDGRVLHGTRDLAAELGHMVVVADGEPCSCGQRGCIEAYASARSVGTRAAARLNKSNEASSLRPLLKTNRPLTSRDVVVHARRGDKPALAVWEETCRMIAIACVNASHWTDPDMVVLGGGMAGAGEFLLEPVRRHYAQQYWRLTPPEVPIVLAQLGNDAGMIGVAGMAMHAAKRNELAPIGT